MTTNSDNLKYLDLIVKLNYLGCVNIDTKYVESSTVEWLIAEIRFLEVDQRKHMIDAELSLIKNLFTLIERQYDNESTSIVLSHKLSDMLKLGKLSDDSRYFGYFYIEATGECKFHAFSSNKMNFFHVLRDHHLHASHLIDVLNKKMEERKKFRINFIAEVSL